MESRAILTGHPAACHIYILNLGCVVQKTIKERCLRAQEFQRDVRRPAFGWICDGETGGGGNFKAQREEKPRSVQAKHLKG